MIYNAIFSDIWTRCQTKLTRVRIDVPSCVVNFVVGIFIISFFVAFFWVRNGWIDKHFQFLACVCVCVFDLINSFCAEKDEIKWKILHWDMTITYIRISTCFLSDFDEKNKIKGDHNLNCCHCWSLAANGLEGDNLKYRAVTSSKKLPKRTSLYNKLHSEYAYS